MKEKDDAPGTGRKETKTVNTPQEEDPPVPADDDNVGEGKEEPKGTVPEKEKAVSVEKTSDEVEDDAAGARDIGSAAPTERKELRAETDDRPEPEGDIVPEQAEADEAGDAPGPEKNTAHEKETVEKIEKKPAADDEGKKAPADGKDAGKKPKKDSRSHEKKEGKDAGKRGGRTFPVPEFPEPGDGSELIKDLTLPTRKEIAEKMVEKHKRMVREFEKELEELENIKDDAIEEISGKEREVRDRINAEVARLKEKRTALKEENRALRREFFSLMDKEETLKGHSKDVNMYSKYMEDLEWKLSTEAIDIETERRLLDELRDTIRKLRQITDGFTPEEINDRLTVIQEKIGENLITIEDLHSRMLEEVEKSNLHHEKYRNVQKMKRERESRKGWLRRRIELHKEMGTFWENQTGTASAMDLEEKARKVDSIRDTLLAMFSERDGAKGEENAERTHGKRKGGRPRKKLEMSDTGGPGKDKEPSVKGDYRGGPAGEKNETGEGGRTDGKGSGTEKDPAKSSSKVEADSRDAEDDDKGDQVDGDTTKSGEVV